MCTTEPKDFNDLRERITDTQSIPSEMRFRTLETTVNQFRPCVDTH
jgi:hypothetical protein